METFVIGILTIFPKHIKDNYLIIFAKDKAFYVYNDGV